MGDRLTMPGLAGRPVNSGGSAGLQRKAAPRGRRRYRPWGLSVVLDRFAAAFEDGDVAALATLVRADVALEMPPLATWFSGREAVLRYLASNLCTAPGRTRLVPAAANGQSAFAAYLRDDDGVYRAHSMIVLTMTGTLITRIVVFLEPALFRLFGLARELVRDCRGRPGQARRRRRS